MSNVNLDAVERKVRPFRRTAWLPEVVDGDATATASKFSGIPALGPAEEWPRCANCGEPMQLFVQLNAVDLPEEYAERLLGGIVQLFYCTSEEPTCDIDCEAWAPYGRSTLARLLVAGPTAGDDRALPPATFPPKRIVGWTPISDLPNSDELRELGVDLSEEEAEAMHHAWEMPQSGEKLGGWPLWIQHIEYPSCRRCGDRMEMLFQIDSDQSLPWSLGDAGVGHITQCPQHRDELAFGWACV